jgi:hypothetical protein
VGGSLDSSLTRVQPVFNALLGHSRDGQPWLARLLAAAPRAAQVLSAELLDQPGSLLPEVSQTGRSGRFACFEYPVAPSATLLAWCLRNPERLSWPRGRAGRFGPKTEQRRRRLLAGDRDLQAEALAELEKHRAIGSRGKWWAFEGWTKVGCCLETEKLILFIEGKRSEPLSDKTSWLEGRNQLVRSLELVRELRPGKSGLALLAVERRGPELSESQLARAAPHLGPSGPSLLLASYLGQMTWKEICRSVGLDFASLPCTVADAARLGH